MKETNDQLIIRLFKKELNQLQEQLKYIQKDLDTNHVELWSKQVMIVRELNIEIKAEYSTNKEASKLTSLYRKLDRAKLRVKKAKIELDEWSNSLHEESLENKFSIEQQIKNLEYMIIDHEIKIEKQ